MTDEEMHKSNKVGGVVLFVFVFAYCLFNIFCK